MARLTLDGVSKRFGDTAAVAGVSLDVEDGGFLAVLGPSGCGKTTLLRLIAGFERLDAGEIRIGDRLVSAATTHLPPERRRIGIVFQNYALWPHLSVAENIGYSLKVGGAAASERRRRVDEALALVGLSDAGGRDTASLSGGQKQRVALARCLVMEPDLILLDEPLANLDQHLRSAMQAEFRQFQTRTGTTMVYITHDQSEAMALADGIAVMGKGRLLQYAPPRQLYEEPATAEVAQFVGEGMVLPVERLQQDGADYRATLFGTRARLRGKLGITANHGLACFRGRDFSIERPGDEKPRDEALAATIEQIVYQGGGFRIEARLAASPQHAVHFQVHDAEGLAPGALLRLRVSGGWLLPPSLLPPSLLPPSLLPPPLLP